MQRTPHDPEKLARRLLPYEADQTSEELAAAAEHTYVRLREHLIVFLGPHGFDSLWARAMVLAGHDLHGAGSTSGTTIPGLLPGLQAPARDINASAVYDILIAAFASFIALLFTFIGADLGFRLLRLIWTELPLDEPDTQTGEVTQ